MDNFQRISESNQNRKKYFQDFNRKCNQFEERLLNSDELNEELCLDMYVAINEGLKTMDYGIKNDKNKLIMECIKKIKILISKVNISNCQVKACTDKYLEEEQCPLHKIKQKINNIK